MPIAVKTCPTNLSAIQHRSSMNMWNTDKIDAYAKEPAIQNLLSDLVHKTEAFDKQVSGQTCRGNPYGLGGMRPEVSIRLYGLVREFRPALLVETGVCNGISTAVILAALESNNAGSLYSIDFPEYADTHYPDGTFWEGKMGAVVPKGKQPGWMIPEMYRGRWRLTIGKSKEKLPALLETLESIDFFLHDSEHSYECMTFEYQLAWHHLKTGGLLVSDDIGWNSAFKDFADMQSRHVNVVDRNMAFIIK
jgi:predicted O-methyltransferase YrrM